MAEIIDAPDKSESDEGEFLDVNELSIQQKDTQEPEAEQKSKSKYAEKSREQLEKELESAQSMIGRQSQDVSKMRREIDDLKTASAYTQGQLAGVSSKDAKKESSPDYFGDPENAIKETVAKELQGTQKDIQEFRTELAVREIHNAHPDAVQIIESPGFQDFIAQSPSRTVSHKAAIDSMDVNLWNELINAYKATQPQPDPQVEQLKQQSPSESVANASMGSTTGSSPTNITGKKIRKADLQRLYIEDRDRYNALWPEIEKAWAEGRVV